MDLQRSPRSFYLKTEGPFSLVSTSSVNEFQEPRRQTLNVVRFTLPYDHDFPSEFVKVRQFDSVALDIFVKLLLPERRARLRGRGPSATVVPVPKTAVNENQLPA